MSTTTIVTIIVIAVAIAMVAMLAYLYLKNRTLDEIRADVYHLILQAEHRYIESGSGKQKLRWVVGKARALLPNWLQAFISEDMLTELVQKWFDAVKDLLDDGKYNESVEDDDDGESNLEKGN